MQHLASLFIVGKYLLEPHEAVAEVSKIENL